MICLTRCGCSNRLIFDNLYAVSALTQSPNGSGNAVLLNSYIKDASLDNEVDIFNISVNGLSGSFYLDKDVHPVLLSDTHQFKIETAGDFKTTHAFILTTNEGIKYYFGGTAAIERTFVRDAPEFGGFTSFYLTKIQSAQGSEINFEYKDIGGKIIPISETEFKAIRTETSYQCSGGPAVPLGLKSTHSGFTLNVFNTKILTAIKGAYITININYDPADADKVASVEVIDRNRKHREFVFNYLNANPPNKRFFLSNIKIYNFLNDTRVFDNEYIFEYNDPLAVPPRMSRTTDLLGYYNGKNSSTLLPNLNLLTGDGTGNNYPDLAGLADRRSYFEYAVKGTLKSITYPTKGKTFFEYEGLGQRAVVSKTVSGNVDADEVPANTEAFSLLSGSEVLDDKIDLTLFISQNTLSGPPANNTANFKILDAATNQVLVDKDLLLPKPAFGQDGPSRKTVNFQFATEKNRQYKFVMKLLRTNYHDIGDYEVAYKNRYKEVNNVGLRLKKTYDFNGADTVNVKRLYYASFDSIHKPEKLPDNLYETGGYTTYLYDVTSCNNNDGSGSLAPTSVAQTILSSQTYSDYFDRGPSFPVVTVSYGGDHFEKGGEEKRFTDGLYDATETLYVPPGPPQNNFFAEAGFLNLLSSSAVKDFNRSIPYEDYNGRLKESRVFSSLVNGKAYMKKRNVFNYDFIESKSIYNVMGMPLYQQFFYSSGEQPNALVTNLALFSLQRKSYATPLNNKIETVYFEEVPLDAEDDSLYKKLTTTTHYYYSNPLHHQLTKEVSASPEGTVNETTYAYAHEKSNQLMIDRNMIGIPLETTTTQTKGEVTKTLGKTETLYPTSLPTSQAGNLVLPLSVKSADQLTGVMSTEVSYDKYDEKGNILQYTTKDGIPVAIVWGYNKTQPIAKIEGITYDQLTSLVSPTAIVTASDNDAADPAKEGLLLEALNSFRKNSQLADMKVTTYTYDPLIGVTSITPPSGIRQVFAYDTANRLRETKVRSKNSAGAYTDKKAAEYKYNYKP